MDKASLEVCPAQGCNPDAVNCHPPMVRLSAVKAQSVLLYQCIDFLNLFSL